MALYYKNLFRIIIFIIIIITCYCTFIFFLCLHCQEQEKTEEQYLLNCFTPTLCQLTRTEKPNDINPKRKEVTKTGINTHTLHYPRRHNSELATTKYVRGQNNIHQGSGRELGETLVHSLLTGSCSHSCAFKDNTITQDLQKTRFYSFLLPITCFRAAI